MTEYLKVRIDAEVAYITLSRPEVHNAFDDKLIADLTQALLKVKQTPEVRVVVLAGEGKHFCAGADIAWMQHMGQASPSDNKQDAAALSNLMQALDQCPKPTVGLVQGAAFGGALGLLACCDIVVADRGAQFCFSEVKIGLAPAVISPYVVRAIGVRQARRYFLTAEKFNAETALAMGLVHQIADSADLLTAVQPLLTQLKANGPLAQRASKELLQMLGMDSLTEAKINATIELIAKLRTGPEAQTLLQKFLTKK